MSWTFRNLLLKPRSALMHSGYYCECTFYYHSNIWCCISNSITSTYKYIHCCMGRLSKLVLLQILLVDSLHTTLLLGRVTRGFAIQWYIAYLQLSPFVVIWLVRKILTAGASMQSKISLCIVQWLIYTYIQQPVEYLLLYRSQDHYKLYMCTLHCQCGVQYLIAVLIVASH